MKPTGFGRLVTATGLLWASLSYAQATKGKAASFQIMETTIDDIHAAFKSG
jgi:hypothetical protein